MGNQRYVLALIALGFCTPSLLHAQQSPHQIGYFCAPTTSSIIDGQYYLPQAEPCIYLSPTMSGFRFGDLFRGAVGSSTQITGHSIGTSVSSTQFGDIREMRDILNIQQGEDIFAAIYIVRNSSNDIVNFRNFFKLSGSPPHQNYGLIRFKYGVSPPAISIAADPLAITEGATSTLSWSATNATHCLASNGWGGTKSLSGTEVVAPTATTTYTLTCTGTGTTVVDVTIAVTPPDKPDPVIIIPGILGSEKNSDGEWVIDPILHTYDDLIATLDVNHYTPDVDLFTFPYNWRNSNVDTAVLLKQRIDAVKGICGCDKVDLVAHSMGGLVARQYIQSEAYEQDVDQLIFLGTPHLGAPKAYLMWEGGEIGPLFPIGGTLTEKILELEAEENGYENIFDYLRNEPIESVRELLPVYDYIFDGSNLREFPENYPENHFLLELKETVDILNNSGVRISNFIGDRNAQTTINGLSVVPTDEYLPLWSHGYPEKYHDPFGDHGLLLGSGDGTVPIASASFIDSNIIVTEHEHSFLPTGVEGEIYQTLTGEAADVLSTQFDSTTKKILHILMHSPTDLLVIAPDGKKVGKEDGRIINEIPEAFYTGFETNTEFITLLNPIDGEYKILTQGTENGEYTVETAYISNNDVTESIFTGNTIPGLVTELNVTLDNDNPSNIEIIPEDIAPPVITISLPEERDYLRSEILSIQSSAEDSSGIFSFSTSYDSELVPNESSKDLFFELLGDHVVFATATDNVGNVATSTRVVRVVATLESTLSDVTRAFELGWMIESVKDKLADKLETALKKSEVDQEYEKFLAKDFMNELERRRGGDINESGYQLLREDVQWLIN